MRKKIGLIIILTIVGFIFFKLWGLLATAAPIARSILLPQHELKNTNGITNILLLGIGGGTHDGPNLTDTIIFASINPKKNTVTLISIPRDLWIPNAKERINAIYSDGQENGQSKGIVYAKAEIEQVTGQQIDYAIRLDFDGFVKAVDELGGLDITVDNTLDDYHYPISGKEDDTCGHTTDELQQFNATASAQTDTDTFAFFPCRFKHLHFDPGPQHMDGETALEYVRSRHGVGSEGTDFARSKRQEKVITAFKQKVLSPSTIFNPGQMISLYNTVKDSIDTDISGDDMGLFLRLAPSMKSAKIVSTVIDYGDYTTGRSGLLVNAPISPEYYFADVLLPRIGDGDFSEIQKYVACEITKGNCTVVASPTPPLAPANTTTSGN